MKKYIGFKMIEAKEMTKNEWYTHKTGLPVNKEYTVKEENGYLVKYADGYESWSPADVFEKAYMKVSEKNTITQKNVDDFIKEIKVSTIGEKTTLVIATLINGFEIIESSSCVDVANYNEDMGKEICIERIKNKIWELLGFLLQTAKNGI